MLWGSATLHGKPRPLGLELSAQLQSRASRIGRRKYSTSGRRFVFHSAVGIRRRNQAKGWSCDGAVMEL